MYLESIHFWLYKTVYLIKKQDISDSKKKDTGEL